MVGNWEAKASTSALRASIESNLVVLSAALKSTSCGPSEARGEGQRWRHGVEWHGGGTRRGVGARRCDTRQCGLRRAVGQQRPRPAVGQLATEAVGKAHLLADARAIDFLGALDAAVNELGDGLEVGLRHAAAAGGDEE